MAVEPKETERGTGEGHEKNGQLRDEAVVRDDEVLGGHEEMPGQISEHCIAQGDGDRAAGGEAVEAVGEVHSVGAADDDQHEEGNDEDAQIDDRHLEKRKADLADADLPVAEAESAGVVGDLRCGGVEAGDLGLVIDEAGGDERDDELPEKLGAARYAGGVLLLYLRVVIHETEEAAGAHGARADGDEGVEDAGADEGGDQDACNDEDSAHRRGAEFAAVEFGEFVDFLCRPYRLADLEGDEFPDDAGADEDGDPEGEEACGGGAEGDVLEEVEERKRVRPALGSGGLFGLECGVPEIVDCG